MSPPTARSGRRDDFWVVSAYFNLAGSRARRDDYRLFRAALQTPLLTVEWHPQGLFELRAGDADRLLQVHGGDPMWQKERLLQLALADLPAGVRYVAWVDCDMLFTDPDWVGRTRAMLEDVPLVQPFAEVAYLDAEQTRAMRDCGSEPVKIAAREVATGQLTRRPAFAGIYQQVGSARIVAHDLANRFAGSGASAGDAYDVRARPAYGHAWAARREWLECVGLYERCVMGAGDLLFAYGVIGHGEALIANHHSVGWGFYGDCASYRNWSHAAHRSSGGRCAAGSGTALHLHHGSLQDRQYRARLDGLKPFALDLDRDIAAEPQQPWSWTRERGRLSRYFMDYLERRREDD